MAEGKVVVEVVGGKSTVTGCFSKYPLKFIIPKTSVLLIMTLSGYSASLMAVALSPEIRFLATSQWQMAALLSSPLKHPPKYIKAKGPDALYKYWRYSQKQVFRVCPTSSLVIVDWITSGRHESGEKWNFELYKSTNHIYLENDQPVFLDTMLLEKQQSSVTIAERMQGYQVIAMLIIYGTNLKFIQEQVQENVKTMMSEQLKFPSTRSRNHGRANSINCSSRPEFVVSCSLFGPKDVGLVVRIAAITTESVYNFLKHQLYGMEPLIGVSPYK